MCSINFLILAIPLSYTCLQHLLGHCVLFHIQDRWSVIIIIHHAMFSCYTIFRKAPFQYQHVMSIITITQLSQQFIEFT